jgi:CheY-like chemotaxis protein
MSEDAQDVVLIVEDEPAIRMILRDYLAGEGTTCWWPKMASRRLPSWPANRTWT